MQDANLVLEMINHQPHISVGICTFRRPNHLTRLLEELRAQDTGGLFTYSIVVADNDRSRSAEQLVRDFAVTSQISVKYCVEPRQNIALARNKAIENVSGEFIAFIDDDEFPTKPWLLNLFKALNEYKVDGVLGPVKPYFDVEPPQWVIDGKFFERPTHVTGYRVTWPETRTGNVLLRRDVLSGVTVPFRPEFGTGGEDVDFFRRLAEKGHTFIWCNEAVVVEVVPASRCNRAYLMKRALLIGGNSPKHPGHQVTKAVTSLVAVPCYALALAASAAFQQHLLVKYLARLLYHASRLLAFLGLRLVTRLET